MNNNRPVTPATQFHACSISKFATSLLALRFVERGLLDLDEDVNNRLRTWKISDHEWTWRKKVTLRSLLCHQAGIIDPEESFPVYHSAQGNPSMLDILTGRTSIAPSPSRFGMSH
ncbi:MULTISPECIES: serine hydrolase [Brevibacillus]|uniref:serine hydrolase n=1 Tax=Brevibacillus TaxID=55080 RepID=UPI001FE2E3AE|nr:MULTISPECIES: serine hydrolase [Brevibacillus]